MNETRTRTTTIFAITVSNNSTEISFAETRLSRSAILLNHCSSNKVI